MFTAELGVDEIPLVFHPRRRDDAVVFLSGKRPELLLEDLSYGLSSLFVNPTAIVSDPEEPSNGRYWDYPEFDPYRNLIPRRAKELFPHIPVYRGSVRDKEFIRTFQEEWRPKVILVACYGQLLPPEIFEYESVELAIGTHAALPSQWGGFNPRPDWPSRITAGARPWESIFQQPGGKSTIVAYGLDHWYDNGEEVFGWSDYFDYPIVGQPTSKTDLGSRVLTMHMTSGIYTVQVVRNVLQHRAQHYLLPKHSLAYPHCIMHHSDWPALASLFSHSATHSCYPHTL